MSASVTQIAPVPFPAQNPLAPTEDPWREPLTISHSQGVIYAKNASSNSEQSWSLRLEEVRIHQLFLPSNRF